MSTVAKAGGQKGLPALSSTMKFLIRVVLLGIVDVFALLLAIAIGNDGNWFLAIAIILTAVVVNVINLVPDLWPMRWMTPSIALLILIAFYPLLYTVYVSFTNYSDGHRYTKKEAVELIGERKFLPEGVVNYSWVPFRDESGNYALWLTDQEGNSFLTAPGKDLQEVTPNESGSGPYDDNGIPTTIDGYALLTGGDRFKALAELQEMEFGTGENPIGILNRSEAGNFQQRWVFDEDRNVLTDKQAGIEYKADDETGDFVAPDGSRAPIGYWVVIGFDNFKEIFSSSLTEGPLLRVFGWTIGYALGGVLTSFAMGLFMAIMLDVKWAGIRVVRSLLLIPWAIPGMISILIWRGMLQGASQITEVSGIIPKTMDDLFGWTPPFFTDPTWAKFAILLVNLWFAYPYFMLISSGAMQSIPSSIYEAARVDGASSWRQFRDLTLPLILVSLGPLLIASFIYNFNNYLLLEALNGGGPPMAGANVPPVGHTDNLITYTYRYAFASGGTRDFGLASAIAVVIFMIVALLTLAQFRLTRRWEEIGENV